VNTKLPLIEGKRPRVVLIAGPTASGKSDLAMALAKLLPATIINADASQVYRDLRIVSARPSLDDEALVPHQLFGHIDGAQTCSAADWAHEAKAAIVETLAEQRLPILVGGSGLYMRILLNGIAPVPEIDPDIRAEVRRLDVSLAYEALSREDAEAAARLAPGDRARTARALEVIRSTGRPLKDWQAHSVGGIGDQIEIAPLILLPPRAWLYVRCDTRFARMLEYGGVDEIKSLLARQLDPTLPVMRAIGVREIAAIIDDPASAETQTTLAQIATRQYAKRQFTWFRNQFPAEWPRIKSEINNENINQLAIKLRNIALT
jgi:tRNA dimethylallyltransferase